MVVVTGREDEGEQQRVDIFAIFTTLNNSWRRSESHRSLWRLWRHSLSHVGLTRDHWAMHCQFCMVTKNCYEYLDSFIAPGLWFSKLRLLHNVFSKYHQYSAQLHHGDQDPTSRYVQRAQEESQSRSLKPLGHNDPLKAHPEWKHLQFYQWPFIPANKYESNRSRTLCTRRLIPTENNPLISQSLPDEISTLRWNMVIQGTMNYC